MKPLYAENNPITADDFLWSLGDVRDWLSDQSLNDDPYPIITKAQNTRTELPIFNLSDAMIDAWECDSWPEATMDTFNKEGFFLGLLYIQDEIDSLIESFSDDLTAHFPDGQRVFCRLLSDGRIVFAGRYEP